MTRTMTLLAPCVVISGMCMRYIARHQSAMSPPPQPPPPPLVCVAPRAPRWDRPRPMSRSTRGGLSSSISGNPEEESNLNVAVISATATRFGRKNDPILGKDDTYAKKRSDRIDGPNNHNEKLSKKLNFLFPRVRTPGESLK